MAYTRLALLRLARRQKLLPEAYHELTRIAGSHDGGSPFDNVSLRRSVGLLGMLMCGLSIVFFVAANWRIHDPMPMFVGLQAAVLGSCVGALRLPRLRVPLALLAFLATGALLAFFGQHYQSGADPWQLFAVWAGLTLPLVVACRADPVWCPWIIVAMTAISLWLEPFGMGGRGIRDDASSLRLFAMLLAFALCGWLSRPMRHLSGAGDWSLNLGVLYSVVIASACGLWGLFDDAPLFYGGALAMLAGGAAYLAQRAAYDIRALSMCALGLDVLIVAGFTKAVSGTKSMTGILLLIGLAIIATLYVTVKAILSLSHRHTHGGES